MDRKHGHFYASSPGTTIYIKTFQQFIQLARGVDFSLNWMTVLHLNVCVCVCVWVRVSYYFEYKMRILHIFSPLKN
jgi:hypothetical protein